MAGITTRFTPEKAHSDLERWVCFYPAYIDRKKTLSSGRKIPKVNAVDNPTIQEMRDVLVAAGFKVVIENKMYSRERCTEATNRGRIRVQLRSDDGSSLNNNFPDRESVMLHLAGMIPHLKSRSGKERVPCIPVPQPAVQKRTTGGVSSKKKGKSRR